MAATVEQIDAEIDALEKALATGVLTAKQGDNLSTFRDFSEIRQILSRLRQQKDELQGTTRRRVRYAYQSSKGL